MLAQQAGRLPHYVEAAPLLHWFAFTVVFTLTGGLAYYTGQITKRALERSKAEIRERERAEDALHADNEGLHDRISQVESLQAELREQALRDALTGLYNRHYLNDALELEIQRADREGDVVSVVATSSF